MRAAFPFRRACGATAVGLVGACGAWQRVTRLDEEKSEAMAPPKKPGIYESTGTFDPSAIEKVAELLKESTRAKMAQQKAEVEASHADERKKMSEYRAASKELAQQARNERRQQDAATREERRRQERMRQEYNSQLAGERQAAAAKLENVLKEGEEGLRVEHEKRLEAIRRESAEVEANLRRETDAKYLKAKATLTAKADRQNHDLRLNMLKEKGKAYRDATLEAIGVSMQSVGAGFSALMGDERRMVALVAVVFGTTLGVAAARQGTRVVSNFVEARLKKPTLVRETSRGYALSPGGSFVLPKFLYSSPAEISAETVLKGAAFAPELESKLVNFARSASNTRKHKAPFRHALLHGRPGTGKTMFAKRLADTAGMDFAILSGGDVLPLGREAVTEIHKLFDWAKVSPRGLLLLVDEADAFCRSRTSNMSEDARNALNAFLYRTGTPSRDILVIFATNAPQLFDAGILDRVDTVINFDAPAKNERARILALGMDEFSTQVEEEERPPSFFENIGLVSSSPKLVFLDGVTSADVEKAAEMTEGFSGREVAKLAVAWRAAAVGASPTHPKLTPKMMEAVTQTQIETIKQKRDWASPHDEGTHSLAL